MFNQIDFGKRLKEFRNRMHLTQKEAAMKIGVSEQALSKWETAVSSRSRLCPIYPKNKGTTLNGSVTPGAGLLPLFLIHI